jgi:hypothetical protein
MEGVEFGGSLPVAGSGEGLDKAAANPHPVPRAHIKLFGLPRFIEQRGTVEDGAAQNHGSDLASI